MAHPKLDMTRSFSPRVVFSRADQHLASEFGPAAAQSRLSRDNGLLTLNFIGAPGN
jgi:hypothetical protein